MPTTADQAWASIFTSDPAPNNANDDAWSSLEQKLPDQSGPATYAASRSTEQMIPFGDKYYSQDDFERVAKKHGVGVEAIKDLGTPLGRFESKLATTVVGQGLLEFGEGVGELGRSVAELTAEALGGEDVVDNIRRDRKARQDFLTLVEQGGDVDASLGETGSKIFNGVLRSFGSAGAAGKLLGSAGLYSHIVSDTYRQGLEEADSQGLTGVDRVSSALEKTTIEGGITWLMGQSLGRAGVTTFEEVISPVVRKESAKIAQSVIGKTGIKGAFARGLGAVAGASGEAVEEWLIAMGKQGVEIGDNIRGAFDLGEAGVAGATGFAAGGTAHAYHGVTTKLKQLQKSRIDESAKGIKAATETLEAGVTPDLGKNTRAEFTKATGLGKTSKVFRDAFKSTVDFYTRAKDTGKQAVKEIGTLQPVSDFRRAMRYMSGKQQYATQEVMQTAEHIAKVIPDKARQSAITNWIEAGGDTQVIQSRIQGLVEAGADPNTVAEYEAALALTPDELQVADDTRAAYGKLLERAQEYDIPLEERANYVNHEWDLGKGPLSRFIAQRKFSTYFSNAKQRTLDSYFDGEVLGMRPSTKAIGELLPAYMQRLSNVITAKEAVRMLSDGKAKDGRPLVAPAGVGRTVEQDTGQRVYLLSPQIKPQDTTDYVRLNHAALQNWKWRASDTEGNPIFEKADLVVHPEAAGHLENVLRGSELRTWWNSDSKSVLEAAGKGTTKFFLGDAVTVGKQTMLGFLSPFHQVQEGTHAIGHQVNPFHSEQVDLVNNPEHMDAALHGLMLQPDRISQEHFAQGLGGSSANLAVWGTRTAGNILNESGIVGVKQVGQAAEKLADLADRYQHYLFHEYIPGLKMTTYSHMVERNAGRFKGELKSGALTMEDIKHLSADQSNAAYGHLNYADMGRDPTVQHLLQIFALAPDFLEARTRFVGQAAQGLVGKVGQEQLLAIGLLGAAQWSFSRILNKIIDDDWHVDDPFEVHAGNRTYALRSVPADIVHLFSDPRKFTSGRLSPISRLGLDTLSGVNYRGEKTTASEALVNMVSSTYIPITLQPLTRQLSQAGREYPVSPVEQLLGSLGLHVSRYSPVSKMYQKAHDWVEVNAEKYGINPDRTIHAISEYRPLRYSLEDSDTSRAKSEITRLLDDKKITMSELRRRVKQSFEHRFTPSTRTERDFYASLDPYDKAHYDAAKEREKVLYKRFLATIKDMQ